MSLVLLKLASGMELIGYDPAKGCRDADDLITLTSAFIVITQQVGPDKIQIGLAPLSMAAASPTNVVCQIAQSRVIAAMEPSETLIDAHRSAAGKVAVARAPVIALR